MNSVTAKNRLPQLRMIPIPGVPLFRYERRVSNRWVACNHSRAAGVVGVYYRRAKRLCASLTDGSETEGVYPSTSSAGSQRSGECFSPIKEFRRDFTEIKAEDEH